MKKIATILIAVAGLVFVTSSAMAAGQALRISQVYGGGGNTGAQYNQDFIEIINASGVPVDISGWAVEYASAAGSWGTSFLSGGVTFNNYAVFPAGTTIQPCSYILIGGATSSTSGVNLPTPDFTLPTNLSAANGNVGLFTQVNSATACGSEIGLVDKVAYGTGACKEGALAAGGLSNTTAAVRNNCGLTDTDQNGSDFTTSGPPVPHNAASGQSTCCLATRTSSTTWGKIKSIYR
jgi:predicted extracellular nuclease